MFFVDASKLGDEFFNAQLGHINSVSVFKNSNKRNAKVFKRFPSLKLFTDFAIETVVPLFNDANSGRKITTLATSTFHKTGTINYDLHRDHETSRGNTVFVTLGLLSTGDSSGTLFRTNKYLTLGREIIDLTQEELTNDLASAPDGFAAVFDPDAEVHASQIEPPVPDYRMLYRAEFNRSIRSLQPATFNTPGDPRCIDFPLAA